MSLRDDAVKAVRAFFFEKMDTRTKELRHCALFDLFDGPHTAEYYKDSADCENWPGYVGATEVLETWAGENVVEVWVDLQSMEVLTDEPSEEDSIPEDIYRFERKDVMRAVFKELVTNGGMSG